MNTNRTSLEGIPSEKPIPPKPKNSSLLTSIQKQNEESKPISFIPSNDFFKNEKIILSPLIFTEKKYLNKKNCIKSRSLLVFEQLLGVVASSYYSSEYNLNIVMRTIKTVNETKSTENSNKNNVKIKKLKGKSKKTKPSKKNGNVEKGEEEEKLGDENVLDYLLSPLKDDFEFGEFIRKMDDKRNGNF